MQPEGSGPHPLPSWPRASRATRAALPSLHSQMHGPLRPRSSCASEASGIHYHIVTLRYPISLGKGAVEPFVKTSAGPPAILSRAGSRSRRIDPRRASSQAFRIHSGARRSHGCTDVPGRAGPTVSGQADVRSHGRVRRRTMDAFRHELPGPPTSAMAAARRASPPPWYSSTTARGNGAGGASPGLFGSRGSPGRARPAANRRCDPGSPG